MYGNVLPSVPKHRFLGPLFVWKFCFELVLVLCFFLSFWWREALSLGTAVNKLLVIRE